MAGKHFQKLDDEALAMHESWRDVSRLVVLVGALSALVWVICTALRQAVHVALERLLAHPDRTSAEGPATILGALLLGGLMRAFLYRSKSWRRASGDGMETALANYHVTYDHAGDDPQPRYDRPTFSLAFKKFVVTLITLGTGGSGGLEAPVVMISECTSAGFSKLLSIRSEYELRTYQLAGISAAVSTLLGAPFTAALFATEVAYGDRIIYRKLAYALWAGIVAYWLNNWLHGAYVPLFRGPEHAVGYSLAELGGAALVAVAISMPLALGFGRVMVALNQLLRARVRKVWHSPVSAVCAGLVAVVLWYGAEIPPDHVLGMGEHALSDLFQGRSQLGAWALLLALLGKAVTTGLTLGGGGSAGLLVPSMYLGGVSGALVAHSINSATGAHFDPALFAVVGVGSSLVAVVGVPLSAIALVFEVFGKSFGPPAILACGVTYLLTLRLHIYENQRASPDPAGDETGGSREAAPAPRASP